MSKLAEQIIDVIENYGDKEHPFDGVGLCNIRVISINLGYLIADRLVLDEDKIRIVVDSNCDKSAQDIAKAIAQVKDVITIKQGE